MDFDRFQYAGCNDGNKLCSKQIVFEIKIFESSDLFLALIMNNPLRIITMLKANTYSDVAFRDACFYLKF